MSWGKRITLLYLGFVALILTLVVTCYGQNVELESKDYYTKELQFQNQINASNNANNLGTPIAHLVVGRAVELTFPPELLTGDFKGSVHFLRPSDSSKDKTISLNPGTGGKQLVSDPTFLKGVYKMQVSCQSNGKSYYKEEVLFLQ